MQSFLPVGNFEWVPAYELESLKELVARSSDTDSTGYMLEVDLDYPVSLHNKHNQYPCAPEHTKASTICFGNQSSKVINNLFIFRYTIVLSVARLAERETKRWRS